MSRISDVKMIDLVIGGSILLITLGCIFPPNTFLFKQGATFSVQIMFVLLFLGMALLVLKKERLMFVALGASGILAFNLKSFSDQTLRYPIINENPNLSVAHISLTHDPETLLHAIRSHDVDVISFHLFDPFWDGLLQDELRAQYPFRVINKQLTDNGTAIFSKFPICSEDTITVDGFDNIQMLHAQILMDKGATVNVISTHSFPVVNDAAYEDIHKYFAEVGYLVRSLEGPVITLGDFSLPPWSEEIRFLKKTGQMLDSRRDISQHNTADRMFLFNIPIEHIFHTNEIECTAFKVINEQESPLGITGNYQFKKFTAFNAVQGD